MKKRTAPRLPAVPLVAHDPYFSIWSVHDRLNEGWPRHWTGRNHTLCGLIRIDGEAYCFCGLTPYAGRPMAQRSVTVWPTRTEYAFEQDGVALDLTFLTPALMDDLDLLSRPLTYVIFGVRSSDGRPHRVELSFDAGADIVVDSVGQSVDWSRHRVPGLRVLRMGSHDQRMLTRAGDDLRIEWGYLYLAASDAFPGSDTFAFSEVLRPAFSTSGRLPPADDMRMPRPACEAWPTMAMAFELGEVGAEPVERCVMLAYDDLFSLEYLDRRLRPYWRRNGWQACDLLSAAAAELPALRQRCMAFDTQLMAELEASGGKAYAQLCGLAYRQCLAAHKLAVDPEGRAYYMSKENFSNGCIDTVDVTYPSAPFFLLLGPELLEAQLRPIMDYAASPRWRFPFAPHDLGTYPLANGQVYGGGETDERDQMPVEECGNMLLLVAALVEVTGQPRFARTYWPLLRQWAEYLRDRGLDPENQLCTDDFAGHLAHNTNLSLKAILGLAGYASLARRLGHAAEATTYRRLARRMATKWLEMADDGDHYRLTFDRRGTWSQKYNLVWDRLLRLNAFPRELARTEVAWYLKKQKRYGLPLDSRSDYTKLDWIVWSATLAEQRRDFEALVAPLLTWLNETPTRVPMTDWYWTTDGRQVGFQARSVVGGLYVKLLADRMAAGGRNGTA